MGYSVGAGAVCGSRSPGPLIIGWMLGQPKALAMDSHQPTRMFFDFIHREMERVSTSPMTSANFSCDQLRRASSALMAACACSVQFTLPLLLCVLGARLAAKPPPGCEESSSPSV